MSVYQLKWIEWRGDFAPIVTQVCTVKLLVLWLALSQIKVHIFFCIRIPYP